VQAGGDAVDVLGLQRFPREYEAPGGVVVNDNASIAVEDLAAGRDDGQALDAVLEGKFGVAALLFNLQLPKAADEEQEDGYRGVLESRNFGSGETGAFLAHGTGFAKTLLGVRRREKIHARGFYNSVYRTPAYSRAARPIGVRGLSFRVRGPRKRKTL